MDGLARHLSTMAALCVDPRAEATAVTCVEPLDGVDGAALRRLLPAVADRHGIAVDCTIVDGVATVRFSRRHARAA